MARPKRIGIYAIYSAINGRIYIGHSSTIDIRMGQHKSALRGNRHHNPRLQRAWDKYGEGEFEFVVLEECAAELLAEREQYHLDQYPDHYNYGICAESPWRGVPHTLEHKAKIGAAHRGSKRSPEARARMSEAQRGKTLSPETKAKISTALTGRVFSREHRAKLSESQTGRVLSPETRDKIGAANRGHEVSPEQREKLRATSTGRKHTPESKAKISESNRRRVISDETRAKMSESAKDYWNRKRAEEATPYA